MTWSTVHLEQAGGEGAILFLDIDGVCHPESSSVRTQDNYLFCRLPLLEGWLRERPGVGVVIASAWRAVHPVDELVGLFTGDLQEQIFGTTPVALRDDWAQFDDEPQGDLYIRESEIRYWLHAQGFACRRWAAIDDQPWLFRPFCPNLVMCDGSVGLTRRELDRLDVVLGLEEQVTGVRHVPGCLC